MSKEHFGSGKKTAPRDPTYADLQAIEKINDLVANLSVELCRHPATKALAGEARKLSAAAAQAILSHE